MIYLLDSNVWVAILRQTLPQVAAHYGRGRVYLPVVDISADGMNGNLRT
jgi:hypothetical protein